MVRRAIAGASAILVGGVAVAQQPVPGAPLMVFFDWTKPEIRRDDSATLDQAVAAWRARPGAKLRLSGHTDRSGGRATNRAAGLERARAVRGELEKRGIPRNVMSVASFGEDQPLVPTEDGVREVQNRRVVIELEE